MFNTESPGAASMVNDNVFEHWELDEAELDLHRKRFWRVKMDLHTLSRTFRFRLLCLFSVLAVSTSARATLIQNGSFEIVPDGSTGQGILPSDWVNIPPPTPTADTYSNDGSYGLFPFAFGNFTGVTAHDGIRWVAGWSAQGQESFGQFLDSNLVAGTEYFLSGWLHQAVRTDLDFAGGYEVYLTNTPGVHTEFLGFLGPTTGVAAGWTESSFSFTATTAMASLGFLEFAPVVIGAVGSAYPGLDLVSLTVASSPVTEPGMLGVLGASLLGFFFSRKSAPSRR